MHAEKELLALGENLYRLRRESGYTQKEMAEICGMSTAMLSKLERGLAPQRLRAIVLYRASRHFRISVETLLTSLSG